MPFRFLYPEPDSLTVIGPTNTTYWLMLLVRTEAITSYKSLYSLAVATEVFALVFGIILHIRGFVLFWKLRALHINFLLIAAYIYASLVIGMIARLLIIPYEMRLIKITGNSQIPSHIKQMMVVGLFEAPIPLLAMMRQGTYAHIYYVLCLCTVERTCATLFVADYEKNTRMHISIILNVFVTIVSHATGYLVVTGVLNALAVTGLAMMANLGCAMWFRWLIVCNERRLTRLTDNLKRNHDEYSLSLRVQLKENVWSMKKIELGIYMLAGGIGANMVLVFAPIYVLTAPAQFEKLQWFICAANLAYALSLLLTAPWLEVAIAIHTGRVPRILRALVGDKYFIKKMPVRSSNSDIYFKQLDSQWTQFLISSFCRSSMLIAMFLLEALTPIVSACAATSTATTPTIPANCRTCDQNLIMITVAGGGAHAFQSDVTDLTGDCAVRTFTCEGNGANIEINNGDGVVNDIDDGAVDMTAILRVTCNAASTGWVFAGTVITQVECASGIV